MLTSGLTAISTSSDTAVDLIVDTVSNNTVGRSAFIINEGSVAGFFSLDGVNWARLPAGPSAVGPLLFNYAGTVHIQAKRVASGSNLTGLWAFTT